MKTISIPTNDRIDTLSRCLASIQAAIGHEEWMLVFSCEPNQRVLDLIAGISWCQKMVSRNACKMGCWPNTFLAANFAMQLGSEFNLYLEDDIVISRDTLILADQFRRTNHKVLALRRPEANLTNEPNTARVFSGGLFGDGFAWRKDLWPVIRSLWFQPSDTGFSMWDWSMEHGLRNQCIQQVRPCLNRSQNIGLVGTHQRGFDPNRHSACYAGEPVTSFRFV